MINRDDSLSRACKSLLFDEPFYGLFLLSLNKVWTPKIKTLCVSKNNISYQLKINEDFWFSLKDEHKKGVLKHELLHCAFFHLTMIDDFEDKKLFNVAADIEINQYIKAELLPEGVLKLDSFPEITLPPKAGTKVYYELLQQAKDEGKSPTLDDLLDQLAGEMSSDGLMAPDHSAWEEFENLTEAEKKLIESQTKHILNELADAVKSRGTIPSEISSILDKINYTEPPKFDWRSYLRRFAGKSVKVYTKKLRKKFNKRFEDNPGLKIKQRKHILVAIDTSGSVSNAELVEFFQEINHIHKTGTDVTVVQCDAAISKITPYKKGMEITIHGRGGTSFDPVIDYYNANVQKYTSLIYMTDGEAPSPDKPKGRILWVLSNRSEMNSHLPGDVIKLN